MQLVHALAAETHIFQFESSIQCKWEIIPVNNNKKSTDLVGIDIHENDPFIHCTVDIHDGFGF